MYLWAVAKIGKADQKCFRVIIKRLCTDSTLSLQTAGMVLHALRNIQLKFDLPCFNELISKSLEKRLADPSPLKPFEMVHLKLVAINMYRARFHEKHSKKSSTVLAGNKIAQLLATFNAVPDGKEKSGLQMIQHSAKR